MYKLGQLGLFIGHSRSSAMSPFDRAHTISYLTLIETMRLSCTVFEIQPAICRKSPILTHTTCIWRPRRGDPDGISRSLASENQIPWTIVWCCFCDPTFSRFSRTPTCDRHRQTQAHGKYRGCIASRGKNRLWIHICYKIRKQVYVRGRGKRNKLNKLKSNYIVLEISCNSSVYDSSVLFQALIIDIMTVS